MGQVQYISDDNNTITAVIVPIELWHELQAEKETAYLLKNEAMRERFFVSTTGKPEALKHEWAGCWFRRTNNEHRLVFEVWNTTIKILPRRHHY